MPAKRNILFFAVFTLLTLGFIILAGWTWRSTRITARNYPAMPRQFTPDARLYLAADKSYGVNADLTLYSPTELEIVLQNMRQTGLQWVRQPLRWEEIEPQPGRYDWRKYDAVVKAASAEGIKMILVLETSPRWTHPANPLSDTPPEEASDFGEFARQTALRYGQMIDFYQVWDEPNLNDHWGGYYIDPNAYLLMLREASIGIHSADLQAWIIHAALAPNTENGPLNLNEAAFLEALYQAGGSPWFDIMAAEPYGFDLDAGDAADPAVLNFSRLVLLRSTMLRYNDSQKPIWLTAFGWNALPADWQGRPSIWGSNTEAGQTDRTLAAMRLARHDWYFAGPMFFARWDEKGLAADDPAAGFALNRAGSPTPLLDKITAEITASAFAPSGVYPASSPYITYKGNWRLSKEGVDIPKNGEAVLQFPFNGTGLDITLRRGDYKAFLYVEIDGQPANALPKDEQGRAYVVLYDPLAETSTISLAKNLPDGPHTANIRAERGWYQWALVNFIVRREPNLNGLEARLIVFLLLALAGGVVAGIFFHRSSAYVQQIKERLSSLFSDVRKRDLLPVAVILALFCYFSPNTILSLLFLGLLTLLLLLKPQDGLPLIAFAICYFLRPKAFGGYQFSVVEILVLLTAAALLITGLAEHHRDFLAISMNEALRYLRRAVSCFKAMDIAFLLLAVLGLMATYAAPNFGVSMREWRVVVFEAMLFYFLIRILAGHANGSGTMPLLLKLLDALVLGVTLLAAIAVYQYFFSAEFIVAEGVRRAKAFYGSPNNLSLVLDRIVPILLAYAFFGPRQRRRWSYAAMAVVCSFALYLTYSKGALLLGIPASLVVLALYAFWKQGAKKKKYLLFACLIVLLLAVVLLPLMQTERFRSTLDFQDSSTSFFRIKLWQSALTMMKEHPWLGVGLDNFLYQYRTRYILPDAWQEPNLSHPHNFLLDFGTRLGLGGILLILWLLILFVRQIYHTLVKRHEPEVRVMALALAASMAAALAHGLVDNYFFLVDLAFIFALEAALVQNLADYAVPDNRLV